MDKNGLLKTIAETGYNVGFGAKKHFATYDIVDKVPGLIGLVSTIIAVYGLVFEELSDKTLAATLLTAGICGLYINFYDHAKESYNKAGTELTQIFNGLRDLYRTVQTSNLTDLSSEVAQLKVLSDQYYAVSLSKQILFSDWYAHYKFFWQHQIDWIDEQKNFKFFRDKVPLSAYFAIAATLVTLAALSYLYVLRRFGWC
jgi:hypothetical protein